MTGRGPWPTHNGYLTPPGFNELNQLAPSRPLQTQPGLHGVPPASRLQWVLREPQGTLLGNTAALMQNGLEERRLTEHCLLSSAL